MLSDSQPTPSLPGHQVRRSYSAPRLELLGDIAQVTSSTMGGMTDDGGGMGKSGS